MKDAIIVKTDSKSIKTNLVLEEFRSITTNEFYIEVNLFDVAVFTEGLRNSKCTLYDPQGNFLCEADYVGLENRKMKFVILNHFKEEV